MSLTCNIMMVRPASFGFNPQTALTNEYQQKPLTYVPTNRHACREFDNFVNLLCANHVAVWVMEDEPTPIKPDAVFPNNWLSTHSDGTVFLYPMATVNRRAERSTKIIDTLKKYFYIKKIIDLSDYENDNKPLEGTGSMVFDRGNNCLYAGLSGRTHPDSIAYFAEQSGFHYTLFHAYSRHGWPHYHTNIMMSVGQGFAVVCLQSITDKMEQKKVIDALERTDKEIITISISQTEKCFAGNMLHIKNTRGEKLLILSARAHQSLTRSQKANLEKYATLLPVSVPFIEDIGGGSVRCMMAEIFLPPPLK